MSKIVQFPSVPAGARASMQLLDVLKGQPEPLIDERTGLINSDAVKRRAAALLAKKREFIEGYTGDARLYWQDSCRARCDAQAAREASQEIGRWINANIKLEYTASERAELQYQEAVMNAAPIDPRGAAIWNEASLAHSVIRDRARLRAVDALYFPLAQE